MKPLFHIIHPEFGCHECGQPDGRCLVNADRSKRMAEQREQREIEQANSRATSAFVLGWAGMILGGMGLATSLFWPPPHKQTSGPNREWLEWRTGIDSQVMGIDRRIKKAIAERPINLDEPPKKTHEKDGKRQDEAPAFKPPKKTHEGILNLDAIRVLAVQAAWQRNEHERLAAEAIADFKAQKFAIGDRVWRIVTLPVKQGETVTLKPAYITDLSSDGRVAQLSLWDEPDSKGYAGSWYETKLLRHADLLEAK